MPTNVRLTLKGLLVLDAKVGRTTGKVGILPAPPPPTSPHDLFIRVTRHPVGSLPPIPDLTRPNISSSLSLDITNAANPPFTIRNPHPINRNQPGPAAEPDGKGWFVDLESRELYGKPIGADSSKFESLLTIYGGGELFTADPPNESILRITPPRASEQPFGRVALILGLAFLSATKAVLKNGTTTVFDSSVEPAGTNYDIQIIHDANTHPPIVEDANNYYTVLGTLIDPMDRILFRSVSEVRLFQERLEMAKLYGDRRLEKDLKAAIDMLVQTLNLPAGPEAACFPAYLGQTNL